MTSSNSQCRLCGRIGPLCESHIIPAFVYRWQKDTSSTGYLRFAQQVNRRVQDGLKVHFLCQDCEARFSVWEAAFASNLFVPFHNGQQTTFQYDAWMSKFCVSISWRVLTYLRECGHTAELETDFAKDVQEATATWADFLLGRTQDVDRFEQHFIPLGAIAETSVSLPENIQRYLMRAVEIDRIWTDQSACVFAKLGHLAVIGFMREPEATLWQGTRIELTSGMISPRRIDVPDWLLSHLTRRTEHMAEKQAEISARQKETIGRTQDANSKRVQKSETLAALSEDLRLGGAKIVDDVPD